MSQSNELTMLYSHIIPNQIYATKLEDNERSKGQKIAYPRYKDSDKPLMVQCEWFELNSYGIPSKNSEFFNEDSKRLFIKVPLDQSKPEIKKFSDWLISLDEHFNSDDFKEKLFGNKKDKYQYQSCYRLPQDEEDDDNEKKKTLNKKDYGPRQPYMKMKIDATYPDNKIKSPIFKSVIENGARTRTKVDNINTIDDLQNHLCFLSKFRPIIRPVKFWAQAPNKKDPMYGITFKMIKAEFEPRLKNNSNIQEFIESDIFLDEDVDEIHHVSTQELKLDNKKIVEIDSSDDESDDDKPPVSLKNTKVESESDDDIEIKQKKVMTIADSDSDDDKLIKKPKSKPKKVMTVADSESDEEDKKPQKKPTKTKKAVI